MLHIIISHFAFYLSVPLRPGFFFFLGDAIIPSRGVTMSWDNERSELIVKYRLAEFNRFSTVEDVVKISQFELTQEWFDALAYFKLRDHYFSLEEVADPRPGMRVYIRYKDGRDEFVYEYGDWVFKGAIGDSLYK